MKKKSNHIFRQHFILQGVLDYWDLDSQYCNIPGTMKYSIYSSTNSLIIGISILGNNYGPSYPNNRGPSIYCNIFLNSDQVDKYLMMLEGINSSLSYNFVFGLLHQVELQNHEAIICLWQPTGYFYRHQACMLSRVPIFLSDSTCMPECKALEIDGSFHFPKSAQQNYTKLSC